MRQATSSSLRVRYANDEKPFNRPLLWIVKRGMLNLSLEKVRNSFAEVFLIKKCYCSKWIYEVKIFYNRSYKFYKNMADKGLFQRYYVKSLAALGRIFQLGDLYNYYQDEIIKGNEIQLLENQKLNLCDHYLLLLQNISFDLCNHQCNSSLV